ncbi:hypothetical protein [uncultured Duncaniella sp.]|uniref:hypothetical protein n=1 Tax=uncultured Duncaniella sp. TaxID=2768039 RepID=UPI00261D9539|nr:hypothetical protein [uncultured Duncaniella sp.]
MQINTHNDYYTLMITPARYYDDLPAEVRNLFLKWGRFLYDDVSFNMPDSPLHAAHHCERVLLHALRMGVAEMGIDDIEALEILAHASVFHDTRRHDEYLDTGHGARAAVYYTEFCKGASNSEDSDCPARQQAGIVFHPEAVYLMRYHDLDDTLGIEAIRRDFPDRAGRVEKLYAIFKDADALDRWRLGRWGLDEKYLRTASARTLVQTARNLVTDTMDPAILAHYDRLMNEIMSKKSAE